MSAIHRCALKGNLKNVTAPQKVLERKIHMGIIYVSSSLHLPKPRQRPRNSLFPQKNPSNN